MFSVSLTVAATVTFIFHSWKVIGAGVPAPQVEYDGWRGKAYLDDTDMVEIANWKAQLNDAEMVEALKYYWVNNEVMYMYGAILRGIFGTFNETTKDKNFTKEFINGVELIIHYIILKSFPVVGRRGGIRGTGQDKVILKAAVPPLIACYNKIAPTLNFTVAVYPIMKRRKKRRVFIKPSRRRLHKTGKQRKQRGATGNATIQIIDDIVGYPASTPRTLQYEDANGDDENVLGTDSASFDRKGLGRYTYTLSHGSMQKAKKTNIVLVDDEETKLENIAVSVFWLIYEMLPTLCQWTAAQITPFKTAIDKIIGLVLSMYLYDTADFAEEYERIFNMTQKQFESEWTKIELFAKNMMKERKLEFTRPYSDLP